MKPGDYFPDWERQEHQQDSRETKTVSVDILPLLKWLWRKIRGR